jgi:hypothetical protein
MINRFGFDTSKIYKCRLCNNKLPWHLLTTDTYEKDLAHKTCLAKVKRGEYTPMRKAELICSCGAKATFEDNAYTPIYKGGKLDEKGRKYLLDKQSDEWQERHQDCSKAENFKIGEIEVRSPTVDEAIITDDLTNLTDFIDTEEHF